MFHYPRYQMTIVARAAGIDAVDGPFADFRNDEAYREECRWHLRLGWLANGHHLADRTCPRSFRLHKRT